MTGLSREAYKKLGVKSNVTHVWEPILEASLTSIVVISPTWDPFSYLG